MTDDSNICGHPTGDGDGPPCQNPATDGDSCWIKSHGGHAGGHGRPTKLDLQRQENIAQAVEQGKSFSSACRKSGITPSTGIRWMQAGEDEDEGPYRDFYDRLTRAKGHGQDYWENRLHEVTEDPATIMAILKTQYPDTEWGEANRSEQAGNEIAVYEKAPDKADLEAFLHGDDD